MTTLWFNAKGVPLWDLVTAIGWRTNARRPKRYGEVFNKELPAELPIQKIIVVEASRAIPPLRIAMHLARSSIPRDLANAFLVQIVEDHILSGLDQTQIERRGFIQVFPDEYYGNKDRRDSPSAENFIDVAALVSEYVKVVPGMEWPGETEESMKNTLMKVAGPRFDGVDIKLDDLRRLSMDHFRATAQGFEEASERLKQLKHLESMNGKLDKLDSLSTSIEELRQQLSRLAVQIK